MGGQDSYLQRASAALELGRKDEAKSWASQAIAQQPDDPEGHVKLAWALLDDDAGEALESAKRALSLDPNYPRAFDVGAQAASRSRNKELAVEFATRYRELRPNMARANRRYGQILYDNGKRRQVVDESVASIREAIRLDPENAVTWNELGRIQADVNQKDEARESFMKALQVDPNNAFAKTELARLSEGEGDKASALALVQSVIRLDPTDKFARQQLDNIVVRFMTDLIWVAFLIGVLIFIGLAFALAPLRG